MSVKKMTFEEWKAYQLNTMAWLSRRISELQAQIWELVQQIDASQPFLSPKGETDVIVSRETKEGEPGGSAELF